MTTHYLAVFSQSRGLGIHKEHRAVCGSWITVPLMHSVEPTCPTCAAWLEADDKVAGELAAQWDAEDTRRAVR